MLKLKSLLFPLILLIIILNIGSIFISQRDQFLSRDFWKRYPELKRVYGDSQYAHKHHTYWISDEDVNTYAGAAYVTGTIPILIAPDTPPLGRYLIGLSEIVFNNENIIVGIFAVLSLFLLYLVGKQIYTSRIIALLPVLLFSFEPLFKSQLIYMPLLDIFQLVFLLACFFFFNKGLLERKKFIFSFLFANIFLGLFISTKFFATGATVVIASIIILVLNKQKPRLLSYMATLPSAIVILLLSYSWVLTTGYSLMKFLGIQKYVYLYHKSQLILPFSIWPLLLLNRWHVWFGDKPVIPTEHWSITWPVVTILSLITIICYLFRKIRRQKTVEILMAWMICYLLFFSFGQIAERYFIILLPVLYLVTFFGVEDLIQRIQQQKKKR